MSTDLFDAGKPADVAKILRNGIDSYRSILRERTGPNELQAWGEITRILERAAIQCETSCHRNGV